MTMHCAQVREHGGLDQLLLEQVPIEQPAIGEVRVRLRASALNHLDLWVRKGVAGHRFPLPLIPGCDGAGVVEALGEGTDQKWLGRDVVLIPGLSCGLCGRCRDGDDMLCPEYGILGETRNGTCAETIIVAERQLLDRPEGISWEQAAALPLSALTAWSMLRKARLTAGDTLLVIAAGSGVGTMAIQLGQLLGARIIATGSSAAKRQLAEKLGATQTLDPADPDWWKEVKSHTDGQGADVIFENVGHSTFEGSLKALARGGRLVTCGATSGSQVTVELNRLFFKNQQIIGSTMGRRSDLTRLLRLQQQRKIEPVIDSTFSLKQIHSAHQRMESRQSCGKIVITPWKE